MKINTLSFAVAIVTSLVAANAVFAQNGSVRVSSFSDGGVAHATGSSQGGTHINSTAHATEGGAAFSDVHGIGLGRLNGVANAQGGRSVVELSGRSSSGGLIDGKSFGVSRGAGSTSINRQNIQAHGQGAFAQGNSITAGIFGHAQAQTNTGAFGLGSTASNINEAIATDGIANSQSTAIGDGRFGGQGHATATTFADANRGIATARNRVVGQGLFGGIGRAKGTSVGRGFNGFGRSNVDAFAEGRFGGISTATGSNFGGN
jgi:hypothetical protein